ncbi:FAD-dependent oxidoreductase [Flavilitoribacter nigricans]|uniref:Pyridine nucleotide-disulfide oxidoreductase n=1 Tax=Flavilitoribacter nigricans (strain ATCC 23147 / DSM 23189 / NBRC 102662 / NCIMB 1420 / SS-2) TaxID=1122177 RepID=A0A2D0NI67_FLAN2|nr:FAD-dependent oxidoreductase [Flavilitoribacter nigricans]PHN08181.1 pyridine nucleotide-disulfide oxidoreductase [Flavilitoribacter nigricans DSM 23189 = NBRC 102662]
MTISKRNLLLPLLVVLSLNLFGRKHTTIFLEAESFTERGGWVIDQQSMDVMGSAYMLAHGLGQPVADAKTTVEIPRRGKYRVWVRTRDWVAPWQVPGAPGKFQVLLDGQPLETTFGTEGAAWHWQDGGQIRLPEGRVALSLHDLTGFAGRCDAIILTTDPRFRPPNELETLTAYRQEQLGFSGLARSAGSYDLVVVGGGIAGICTAVSAARLGCRVALIQNRPVLGGNNSSEVRVGLSGLIYQKPYVNLGSLVDEIGGVGHWTLWEAQQDSNSVRSQKILDIIRNNPEKKEHNAGPASNYRDDKKLRIVQAEENLSLFLNTHVLNAEKTGDRITAVIGRSIVTGEEFRFEGRLFADCTGDGNLGALVDADFRVGRESKAETGEPRAPARADQLVMGTSVQWNSIEENQTVSFPDTRPWAVDFTEETSLKTNKGDWDWETGANRDQVTEIEMIRDYGLRVAYGNWDFIKNRSEAKADFANRRLSWVAYIGGKRESRRLLGDVILKEQDILENRPFPDGTFTTTWGVDLHFPITKNGFSGEPFLSRADIQPITPYQVPYRCLYSRNVDNLFMAGRNISVTHVALGTIRVQRTTGMMGEVIGMAASVCKKRQTLPRGVFADHFADLQQLMEQGIGQPDWENYELPAEGEK